MPQPPAEAATADPYIFIEEQSAGYVRYWRSTDDRRWIVNGTCIQLGNCIIGSEIKDPPTEPVIIQDHDHIEALKLDLGVSRLGSQMDTPVTPEFTGCCPFTFEELPSGPYGGA